MIHTHTQRHHFHFCLTLHTKVTCDIWHAIGISLLQYITLSHTHHFQFTLTIHTHPQHFILTTVIYASFATVTHVILTIVTHVTHV